MATRSEPVVSIGDVEGVEIRASVLRCETIAAICINVNLNLVRRLRRSAVRRDMSIGFAEQQPKLHRSGVEKPVLLCRS